MKPAINDAGAVLTATRSTPFAGAVAATFTHGDGSEPPGEFTAEIDAGDGHASVGTVSESNGTYAVSGSHAYAQSGSFAVNTTVSDDGATTVLSGGPMVASAGSPHAQYITAVYEDVLGRAADADGGRRTGRLRLDLGAATSSVAKAIAHSDEYYANFVIKPAYLKLLGRAADDAGVHALDATDARWTHRSAVRSQAVIVR